MTEAWDQIVSDRAGKQREGERELRAVFVLGTIIAGSEAGFELPAVSFAFSFMWMIPVGIGVFGGEVPKLLGWILFKC